MIFSMARFGVARVRGGALLAAMVFAALALAGALALPVTAQEVQKVPAPKLDEPLGHAASEVAVLAGGCFWGVQGVFQHVKGVTRAVSGYTGGAKSTAQYEKVGNGWTGHAESVRVTFDPRQITYGELLRIFFSVVHDPTELDMQGPDEGTQYRSAIFPTDADQARIAVAYIAQLDAAHVFKVPIVTDIEMGRTFYPAESYHQDYLTLHPHQPYIVINDLPKIANLKRLFPEDYREQPVLVMAKDAGKAGR